MKKSIKTPLLNALLKSSRIDSAAFYAPGHKRGRGASDRLTELMGATVFSADLPELPELDNLFAPEGVIKEAQQLAATTFGAERTWFLVNGSTCGIMAAILATCGSNDKIIMPRNIHQSAIAGVVLAGAIPIFINPEYNQEARLAFNVSPEAVARALEQHPDAKAVLMLHPTYQGICSDLRAIAEITHQYDLPLLVDEAHGAHFAFHDTLPPSAMNVGADLSVQSTHKTLSALTQASMLHLQGDRVCSDRVSRALQLVESSSPSYLLLASLDAAREQMAREGERLMSRTLALAERARTIAEIPQLSVLTPQIQPGCQHYDPTRLTLDLTKTSMTGFEADELLHEQLGVTCELPLLQHLTFIISLGNNTDDIHRLIQSCQVLSRIAIEHSHTISPLILSLSNFPDVDTLKISPREAYFAATETTSLDEASDRLCGELICPYPPGIPLLMPGETITPTALDYLQQVIAAGGTITGCKDPTLQTIQTLK